MKEFQRNWCKNLMDKLKLNPLSQAYWNNGSDSYLYSMFQLPDVKLLTFEQIWTKLEKNSYDSITKFISDMRLVIETSVHYFDQTECAFYIAKDISKWFEKKIISYPRTPNELWFNELVNFENQLHQLLYGKPLIENGSNFENSSNNKNNNLKKDQQTSKSKDKKSEKTLKRKPTVNQSNLSPKKVTNDKKADTNRWINENSSLLPSLKQVPPLNSVPKKKEKELTGSDFFSDLSSDDE